MTSNSLSRHDFMNYSTGDVGQAVITAGVAVGQAFVVEAEEMQDRRVEVVDVDFILDRSKAEFVGRSVSRATLHAGSREPRREAEMIVVAAIASFGR